MWEMHLAIMQAPPGSLGEEDSRILFHALQTQRNCGKTIPAQAIVEQYLERRRSPAPAQRPVPVSDDADLAPPCMPVEDAGDNLLTASASASGQAHSTGELLRKDSHPKMRQPLAVKVTQRGAESSGSLGSAGPLQSVPGVEAGRTSERGGVENVMVQKQTKVEVARARRDQYKALRPGDRLDARLKEIHHAHARADEGMRMSMVPK